MHRLFSRDLTGNVEWLVVEVFLASLFMDLGGKSCPSVSGVRGLSSRIEPGCSWQMVASLMSPETISVNTGALLIILSPLSDTVHGV